MKKKILLFLLFHLLFGFTVSSKNLKDLVKLHDVNFEIPSKKLISSDTIKKHKKKSRISKTKAVLSPPSTTAGSSCGDGVTLMQVNVYAFGANGSETIEWFTSQTSVAPIYTGTVYSPSISSTRTYYVRSRSGSDISTRVPVVASIYIAPPAVTLTASPANNTTSPLCLGTSVTFTASGGADLFEFSVDGVVMQGMSTSRVFTTNALTDGQTVKVRTRYAVTMDGSITETSWGTGALEDNFLSAPLSSNASTGYVNSLKISALEDKVVLGITGKVLNNRSILLFLDTKTGGFNISNYGDEANSDPLVRAFNIFNNNPSTFDSYFQADYCLVITTDAAETNYYANVIELKTGASVKTYLGSAATGIPSSVMGVNKNNSGINDYSLGFEVEVLKSLIGYTTGDIKFFALTMNDKEDGSQSVTNSFLSPERSSNLDYGIGAIDYNLKDPNPVVVSSAALTPCYSEANIIMNFVSIPTTASLTQPTCALQTGTIVITTQPGVEYSLNGSVYQDSNAFSGLVPGNYTLYVRNKLDNTCVLSSVTPAIVNPIPNPPVAPTTASVTQPTCGTPSGSILITTQTGVEYSLNGTTYQASNSFTGLAPGNYTLYVRNTVDNTCTASSGSATTINAIPTPPVVPTTASVTQPTCGTPSGSIVITTQTGVEYSLNGTTYQASNTFSGLAPGTYTLYARNTADNTCVTPSGSQITINTIPTPPVVPTTASVTQPTCVTPSGSIVIATQTGIEYSLNGTTYQASNTFSGLAPGTYTLYVRNTADNTCVSPSGSAITINAIPISPVVPTASVVQPTCGTPSGSILITTQTGVEYSLDGTTYQASNSFAGLAPGTYALYVRNTADNTCVTSSGSVTTINAIPNPPVVPTTASIIQPTCGTPSGSIVITTQTGIEYSLNGTAYQASNTFSGLAPGTYTLYVRNTADNTCVTSSGSTITINTIPAPPVLPTTASVTQPTCGTPSGSIVITAQIGVEYSLNGTSYQASNTFSGLVPGDYTLYVRNTADNTCVTSSGSAITINAIPIPPLVPTASVVQPTCGTPSGSITITTQTAVEYSLNGTTYQASNTFTGLAPGSYTLYVRNTADNTCITSSGSAITINAIPTPPVVPTTASVTQPTCGAPSGSIVITTQTGVEYSLNGTTYQASNTFSGLAPGTTYTLYVRSLSDTTCVTSSVSTTTINPIQVVLAPTVVSVVQPTCAVQSGSIVITTQPGVEYSLNGITYRASNTFNALVPGNYTLYVRNTTDISCLNSSASVVIINPIPTPPAVPTMTSVVHPTCSVPSGTIVIAAQSGVEYSLNGTTYQASNTLSGLAPNNYTLYVRNIADNTCSVQSLTSVTVNPLPLLPSIPTLVQVTQPTCLVPSGSITTSTQANVQYSIGSGYQNSNVFNNLAPGKYIMSVRFTNSIACITLGSEITINAIPPQIQFETISDCENKEYTLTANPLSGSYDPNNVSYQWKNKDGNSVGTNSNVLNVTDVIASTTSGQVVFPVTYTLTVTSTNTGCETSSDVVVESIYCNIQKGISPDGNGSNDFFDLRLMDVKKLEIFNRYGIKVYSQTNYTDQWKGQSDKGEDLPSATYYYVIESNNGEPKTGWIYLIREKQ
ncbi:gliding motility-associated C-terminal domain-containing protein [Flavobacterium sp. GT3P67]|uniref:gliding motility-associated C-terminal domain-containing protein n=1 Tax=Flavobacterium sp. GT3P67 TaxID=2541722 RepID=UPI00104E6FFA|nr:gliding motility-associated C-terminal domain-containing protein [Flavobacterium sp. GT3P67]TDE51457.1 gliding motility-associated C-terminal domain-containing protein [Flavobacterium sp. GT3P67]